MTTGTYPELRGTSAPPRDRRPPTVGGRGIRLGRWFGVAVRVDYSLVVIAALVIMNLGVGVLPAWHPGWSRPLVWLVAIVAALAFFASILAHELGHALVGRRLGVAISGITLFMFGGMAHLEREPDRPKAEFLMAIVGPIISLAIGFGSIALGAAIDPSVRHPQAAESALRHLGPLATLLLWLGPLNLALGIFNLVPGFPLDGGRVLRAVLWWAMGDFRRATAYATGAGRFFGVLLMALGVSGLLGFRTPFAGGGIQGLWLLLIGWFLYSAARASYQQAVVLDALEHVPVARLMHVDFDSVDPRATLSDLWRLQPWPREQTSFPVVVAGELQGMVSVGEMRRIPEAEWDRTPVSSVMIPRERLPMIAPSDASSKALLALGEGALDELPVIDQGRLAGIVHRRDLLRWLSR